MEVQVSSKETQVITTIKLVLNNEELILFNFILHRAILYNYKDNILDPTKELAKDISKAVNKP